jgi:hypothetical protein
MESFRDVAFQALYRHRSLIGHITTVEMDEQASTAQVDKYGNVQLGPQFCKDYIRNMDDMAFVLAHEASHQHCRVLIASDFETNMRYSMAIQAGWGANFLEDLLINQSLFHAIPSNLVERFYKDSEWQYWLLQRRLEPFDQLKDLTPQQQVLLSQYRHAAVDWYKQADISLLLCCFKASVDFLLSMPRSTTEKLMVKHGDTSEDSEGEGCDGSSDSDKPSCGASDSAAPRLQLRIPLVDTPAKYVFKAEALSEAIQSMSDAIAQQGKHLNEEYSQVRREGYSNPHIEELIHWDLGLFIPWSEPKADPISQSVVVIFDCSGSMFKFLTLLNTVRAIFKDRDATYWAFSDEPTQIDFHSDYALVETGFSTMLDAVLDILVALEPSNVYIVSDGSWRLSPKYPPEVAEQILMKHQVVLLQQGARKLPYVKESAFTEIVHL